MNKFSEFLAWETTSRDTIDFKRAYVDITGDLVAGLMLSQIIYWHLPDKNGESKLRVKKDDRSWLAKKRADWWEECRISARQADRALKILEEKEFVTVKVYKFDGTPTTHISLNTVIFLEAWEIAISRIGDMEITKRGYGNHESVTSLTETTTENTRDLQNSEIPPEEYFFKPEPAPKPQRTAAERRKSTEQAMVNGLVGDRVATLAIESEFNISPNWQTRTNRKFIAWLKLRPKHETVAQFGEWWKKDWRGKDGSPPTLNQIQELWPQAFSDGSEDSLLEGI